jgi:hypothetical protein
VNPFRVWVLILIGAVGFVGCGPSELPFTDDSKDTTAFAKSVKSVILNVAEESKTSKQPADSLRAVVQTLSELDACPTGEHLKTYKEVFEIASDLLARVEKGKPSDFQSKIDSMVKLANSLPGDVKVEKETSKD